jgi:hypothetical protein
MTPRFHLSGSGAKGPNPRRPAQQQDMTALFITHLHFDIIARIVCLVLVQLCRRAQKIDGCPVDAGLGGMEVAL